MCVCVCVCAILFWGACTTGSIPRSFGGTNVGEKIVHSKGCALCYSRFWPFGLLAPRLTQKTWTREHFELFRATADFGHQNVVPLRMQEAVFELCQAQVLDGGTWSVFWCLQNCKYEQILILRLEFADSVSVTGGKVSPWRAEFLQQRCKSWRWLLMWLGLCGVNVKFNLIFVCRGVRNLWPSVLIWVAFLKLVEYCSTNSPKFKSRFVDVKSPDNAKS